MIGLLENPLNLIWLATVLCWFVRSYYTGTARKLKEFPTVGSTLPLLSLIGTVQFVRNAKVLIETGTKKVAYSFFQWIFCAGMLNRCWQWPHRLFKIPTEQDWLVIVTNPRLIEELSKAPEEVLSATLAFNEVLQMRYTFGSQIEANPYHVSIVRTKLTRSIPELFPVLHDEIVEAFSKYIPPTNDWSSMKLFDVTTKVIAQGSNRIIVGLPLCNNPDWIELNTQFTIDVVLTGFLLGLFPSFMRPLLNFCFSPMPRLRRKAFELFESTITTRRKEREEIGDNKPNDFLSWLMDKAEGEENEDGALLERVLTINFVAIHTTASVIRHAVFDLLSHQEYIQPLREEVEEVLQSEGWTKSAIDQMHKIDSFVKESQRLHPSGFLPVKRVAIRDYTFSDGQTIPAGTTIAVPASHTHFDPSVYENPLEFDGFRFLKMKERSRLDGNPDKKFDMISTSAQFLPFGHGRHACPGRFFAAAEIKMMLAYMLMTYDMKLADGVRPPDIVFMNAPVANPFAEVLFRRRQC